MSKTGRTVGGALSGFAMGGPVGAVAGGLAGLFSGGGDTSVQESRTTSTEQMNLRKWTGQEQGAVNQAFESLGLAGAPMSPEERADMEQKIYDAIYNQSSSKIQEGFASAEAGQYAAARRRGGGNTSASADQQVLNKASLGRELGFASDRATLGAREGYLAESADRRQTGLAELQKLSELYRMRESGSKITRTSHTTGSYQSPDTFWQSAALGVGDALRDEDSWLRTSGARGFNDFFGGA